MNQLFCFAGSAVNQSIKTSCCQACIKLIESGSKLSIKRKHFMGWKTEKKWSMLKRHLKHNLLLLSHIL